MLHGDPAQRVSVGIFPYQVILRTIKPQTLPLNTVTHDERSSIPETTAIKDKVIESDDELEYIDEPENGTVVQGIAGINIAEGDLEGIRDSEPFAEQPSSSTTNAPNIINGIVPTVAASLSRAYTPHLVSSSLDGFGIKIDGFTIINWLEFRKNFTPKYFLGRDLPHTLQDYINHMSEWTRSLPDMRTVFSAAIQENTALDEPDAPSIQIENVVDDEPTPPWEFHYSNYMWHGEGVPPPDVGSLISCDCIGRCDPRSGTCACALRQREAIGDPNADFAYDHRGRLREPGYPIFECNDLCACDDDCRNRVVQHGRTCSIVIKKTENKGWGVFAGQKKIYKGAFVGVYAGELITDEEGEERGRYYNKLGKTYLFDIDFHHLRKDRDDWQSKYTVDAYHVGNNHSCDPNCILNPCYVTEGNIEKPLLAVFARREIEPGEELCFSYSGDVDDEGDGPDGAISDGGTDEKNDAVYARCYCGARNCKGLSADIVGFPRLMDATLRSFVWIMSGIHSRFASATRFSVRNSIVHVYQS
ncbi:hypothetical protein F5887DRAFT_885580 [Amanita rubescens]|nr:hypothetical protein F5887DRAFT_886442 [Amanita rubescens]KAF8344903.1 hypothetical protein F5887DRAFT_885580 [Amanita rubescens]